MTWVYLAAFGGACSNFDQLFQAKRLVKAGNDDHLLMCREEWADEVLNELIFDRQFDKARLISGPCCAEWRN